VLIPVVEVIVDTVDDVQGALGRRGHQDLLHTLIEVGLEGLGLLVMLAGGLDHQVAPGPVGIADALVGAVREDATVDPELGTLPLAVAIPGAVHRVELDQVRRALRITGDLVDLDKLDPFATPSGTEAKTSHAAEPVDTYACSP
jgi:hypothetical protein